jgi:hypothetical protein
MEGVDENLMRFEFRAFLSEFCEFFVYIFGQLILNKNKFFQEKSTHFMTKIKKN